MLTPCQRGKVVIVDAKWVMLVCMFIMGGGLCKQVGWANVYVTLVLQDFGENISKYSGDAYL